MIRARLFRTGEAPVDTEIGEWAALRDDEAVTLWVDAEAPSDAELTGLVEQFGLDPRAGEIARRANRRPTVRFYEDHYIVTVLDVDVDETQATPRASVIELDLVVGTNFLISIHERPLPIREELDERLAANPRLGRYNAGYLLHVFVDALLAHYGRELNEVEDAVSGLEKKLLRDATRRGIDQMMVLKEHIQAVRRLMASHRDTLGTLVGSDSPIEDEKVEGYFRDSLERLDGLVEQLDHMRDAVTGSYSLYISSVSHRTSQQLRVLTYLSAILLPMTAITGLFGTNFKLAEYEAGGLFYVMLAGMGLIAAGMLTFFRLKGWL